MKMKISPVARDGNVKRESEQDGDKRFFLTGSKSANPAAAREYTSNFSANQR